MGGKECINSPNQKNVFRHKSNLDKNLNLYTGFIKIKTTTRILAV